MASYSFFLVILGFACLGQVLSNPVQYCYKKIFISSGLTCENAPRLVSCIKGLDVVNPEYRKQIPLYVNSYESYIAQCSANNTLNQCRKEFVPKSTITCDTVRGYLSCLKDVDVSKFWYVQEIKDRIINKNEEFQRNQCQVQKMLDDCANFNMPNGSITCSTVSGYLTCLDLADVSSSDVLHEKKLKSMESYGAFEKECEASAQLSKCLDDNEVDGHVTCQTVDPYLECVRSVDVSDAPNLEEPKHSALDKFTIQARKCAASAALEGCWSSYVPTGTLSCEVADMYYMCLVQFGITKFLDVQNRHDQMMAQVTHLMTHCRDLEAFEGCKDKHLVDGERNCKGVPGYIQCLQLLTIRDHSVENQIRYDLDHLGHFAGECLAQDRLTQCTKSHATDGSLTCDTLGGYVECIKAVDVVGYPTVEARKNDIVSQQKRLEEHCQGQSANAADQKKLDDCANAHISGANSVCDYVPGFLNCLRQVDVSSSPKVQKRKMDTLAAYKPEQMECEVTAALNHCTEDNAADGEITCGVVDSYLECLKNVDTKGMQVVEHRKRASLAKFENFSGKCKANEKLNKCSKDHATDGVITCATVGGYLDCIKTSDVSGYPTVQERKNASIHGKEEFQSQCTARPPAPKTRKECIKKHAPRRVLNCKNSVALQNCLIALHERVPRAVSRKVDKCEANKPVFACVHQWAPKWAINCQTGERLLSCLQNLVLGPDQFGAVVKKNRLIEEVLSLLKKWCPAG